MSLSLHLHDPNLRLVESNEDILLYETGHIPGAYQFTPYSSLSMDTMLKNLPMDKTIIVYCWTGQHSSQVTFALNVMGYNALSLTYGANSLMHSDLTGHKWADTNVRDYPLHNTPTN